MRHWGTVAYYSAAVVAGALSFAVFIRLGDSFRTSPIGISLFDLFVAALVAGSFAVLVSALLIRQVAVWLNWRLSWQWFVLGGVATFVVARVVVLLAESAFRVASWTMFITLGPSLIWDRAPWALFPAGASMALVLRQVHITLEYKK